MWNKKVKMGYPQIYDGRKAGKVDPKTERCFNNHVILPVQELPV